MPKNARKQWPAFLVVLLAAAGLCLALTTGRWGAASPTPSLAASPNAMAVDAVSGGGIDTSRAVSGTRTPFGVDIVITGAGTGYQGYQYYLEWDPDVLAYDTETTLSPGGLTICGVPAATDSTVFAGCVRQSGTTTFTGPVSTVSLHCVGDGTSPLHLKTMVQEPALGSTTIGPYGVLINTSLADASVICQAVPTPTNTPTPSITPTPTITRTPTNTPTASRTPTSTPTFTPTPLPIDTDGDGCRDGEEPVMGFDPLNPWDYYDVPVPVHVDPTPNGPRDHAVAMGDVLAVLFYSGTLEGGPANGNGVSYDSLKDGDWNGDTAVDADDRVGLRYDRSPGPQPNPPFDAGPPDGSVAMGDVLIALSQVGLNCMGLPSPTTTPTRTKTPTATPTRTITPTPTITVTPVATPRPGPGDADGDGCPDSREPQLGLNPHIWYDFYDVPVPVHVDPAPNGAKDKVVDMGDVLAVLFYSGTSNEGPANGNGVDYDSDKNGDTVDDGVDYDRSASPQPNPPWDAGPPDGSVATGDVLGALAQVGLDCSQ